MSLCRKEKFRLYLESRESKYGKRIYLSAAKKNVIIDTGCAVSLVTGKQFQRLKKLDRIYLLAGKVYKELYLTLAKIEIEGISPISFFAYQVEDCLKEEDLEDIDIILGSDFFAGKKMILNFNNDGTVSSDSYIEMTLHFWDTNDI